MNCARRLASAIQSTSSTTSAGSWRPDAPAGRARLSAHPVLALLLGALGLFAAGPAAAQVTAPSVPQNVSVTAGEKQLTLNWQAPSSWGTWPAKGYLIQWKFSDASEWINEAFSFDPQFPAAEPDGTSFVFPGDVDQDGVNADPQECLEAWLSVFSCFPETDDPDAIILHTISNNESYDLRIRAYSKHPTEDQYRYSSYVTVSNQIPSGPPSAPANLRVTSGVQRLDVSWNKGGTAVTGYDLHYKTWNAPDSLGTGSDPATGWVAATHSGASTTGSVTGLTGGEAYYVVRVRSRKASGDAGPWSEPAPLWSARLTVGDGLIVQGAVFQHLQVGCRTHQVATTKCDSTSFLTGNTFSYEGQRIQITEINDAEPDDQNSPPRGLYFATSLDGREFLKTKLTLCVHASAYPFTDAILSTQSKRIVWLGVDAGWSVGDQVFLRLQRSSSCAAVLEQPPAAVSLSAPSQVVEGSSVTVTATLSSALASDVTIPVTITDNTADSGDRGTLAGITVVAGQTTGTGMISTNQDADQDDETFTVSMGPLPLGVTAGSPSSLLVTITDDENPLKVSATPACGAVVTDLSVQPTWQLKQTPAPGAETAVDYRPVDVNGNGLGLWAGHIAIRTSGNSLESARESPFSHFRAAYPGFAGFQFRLRNQQTVEASCTWRFGGGGTVQPPPTEDPPPGGGNSPPQPPGGGNPGNPGGGGGGSGGGGGGGGGGSTAAVRILHAEPVVEGMPARFEITLDEATRRRIDLLASTTARTATEGADYEGLRRHPVTISPGESGAWLEVATLRDADEEDDETFTVTLSVAPDSAPARVVRPEARGTILDGPPPGASVPLFPAGGLEARHGFLRVIDLGGPGGPVSIAATDDGGVAGTDSTLRLAPGAAAHFNSSDLEGGNPDKGLQPGAGAPTSGDWRLFLTGADVGALAYVRTQDGFVTPLVGTVPAEADGSLFVAFLNPGSNFRQVSLLRLANPGDGDAAVTVSGIDDAGAPGASPVRLTVPAGEARVISAQELERGASGLEGMLGDGKGKWRLNVSSDAPVEAMSLLESPTGHLANLSAATAPRAEPDHGIVRTAIPLFPAAGDPDGRQGFVRVINRGTAEAEVLIEARDDAGKAYPALTLAVGAGEAVHLNSDDLELGAAGKGLPLGTGPGGGRWRLDLAAPEDVWASAYIRHLDDGFVTGMNALAPVEDGAHRVDFLNPASNWRQASRLRLINPGAEPVEVTVAGTDDAGEPGEGSVSLTLAPNAVRTLTAAELESGGDGLEGELGDGAGKWRLRVTADGPVRVMGLLESPTGHLANLSAGTRP